ncbi:hypothetical protein [Sandarakinorhabdus oryzae]|uniref:hypothetical protein n=1 Tax=Sandarakinorhabdus oryzae TaxID=2675220 RepID=UPI0012E32BD1|nr:hypothetical protein [Sandarakinorhabdus oryzae]
MTNNTEAQRDAWSALAAPIAVACWVVTVLFNPGLFNDSDTNWHLAAGDLILRTGTIPTVDPFSWTATGRPWVAHEWLSEVFMALAYKAASWTGLAMLAAAALALILSIIAIRAGQWLEPQRAVTMMIVVAAALAPTTMIRPHLLAFALLTVWTMLLIDARRKDRVPPWWSVLVLVLWVNMHASWVLGIALSGAFGFEALLRSQSRLRALRNWSVFGIACLAATLINPQGFALWAYPFDVSTMSTLYLIEEWRPMDVRKDALHLASMALVLIGVIRLHRQMGIVRILLLAGLMLMAILHIRHLAPFVLVSSLVLLDAVRDDSRWGTPTSLRPGRAVIVGSLIILAGFGARLFIPLVRQDNGANPMAALAAVPPQIRALPVINHYDFGGVLILNGIRPYVDGRADMYGDVYMQQYIRILAGQPDAVHKVLADGKVGWIIVQPKNGLVATAEKSGWRRLHADQWAVVLIRPDLASTVRKN